MKKIKYFALAAFAMLSTNAFATVTTQEYTYEGLVYVLSWDDNGTTGDTTDDSYYAEVKKISDDATYKAKTTWEIPEKFKALADNGATTTFAGKTLPVTGILANAFANNSNITSITFAKAANIVLIQTGAFSKTSITSLDLSGTQITQVNQWFENTNTSVTAVSLPTSVTTIAANAFDGLSELTSVTFAAQTAPAVYGLTINADAFKNTMKLKTLTLPANVTSIVAGAFNKTYLETLTINGKLLANAVATGAFVKNGSQTLTFNYSPAQADEVANAIAQDAFAAAAGADVWVTFNTTTHYGGTTIAYAADAKGNKIWGATLKYDAAELDKIKVYNQGGTYSYGTFIAPAAGTGIIIDKKQGDANVMVYGAYVDNAKTPAILMDQLHLIGGKYYVPAGTKIIVKSSGTADVEYTTGVGGNDSRNHKVGSTAGTPLLQSEIKAYGYETGDPSPAPDTYAANITAPAGQYVIFLKPLSETTFGWAEFTDSRIIKDGQFYMFANVPAAAMRVIWLDGSEEDATAIKNVKAAAKNDGAIYNLAGQKVNAAYKGVVIKDGKKYIQK